jgi:hypothetical protein
VAQKTLEEIDRQIAQLTEERLAIVAVPPKMSRGEAISLRKKIDRLNSELSDAWNRMSQRCPHPSENIRIVPEKEVDVDFDGTRRRVYPSYKVCGLCERKL